ncbi:MAG TPA: murein biosynthesis integral membrane protein MurJ [Roseiflexaceae bacterium]|nr:murein biosynthesis integral membrane protein MurJ [Roseiflexaceae bacterium]
MPRSKALFNTLIVAGGYLASRLLGLGRDVIISAQFGTQPALDAFRASFGILDLIYLVIAGGALGSAFIPVFSELLAGGRVQRAWQLANAILSLACAALLIACSLIAIFAEPIIALSVGRGFDTAQQQLTAHILRLMLIQPIFLGLGGLAKATLESFDRFTLPAIGANLYNLGIIGGALLAPWGGIDALLWGVNSGALLFLLVQLPGLQQIGARPMLTSPLALGETRRVLWLLAPRLFGQSAWQINLIAIASFASTLGSGAVAANGYALQLMMLPHGLIALSVGTVIFPQLARLHASDLAAFRATTLQAIRGVLFVALPAAAGLGILALPGLRALFQRGAFDATSASLTAAALTGYAVGLAAFAAAEIIVRAFYAMQDTRTPVVVASLAVGMNLVIAWAMLQAGYGLFGLGLAFSIANIAEALVLLLLLRSRIGRFGHEFRAAMLVIGAAGAVCGSVLLLLQQGAATTLPFIQPGDTYRWPEDFPVLLAWLVLCGALASATYLACTALFGLGETRQLAARLRRR